MNKKSNKQKSFFSKIIQVPVNYFKKRKEEKRKNFEFWKKYKDPGLAEYIMYLSSPFRILWANFLAGIGRGFGFIIGATVVVALLVYIVSQILVEIPIVGKSFEWLDQFLRENLNNGNMPTGGSKAGGL